MLLALLLSLQAVSSIQTFNLDETDTVFVPVGQSVECHKKAEIHKAKTWVVEDLDIIKLQFKTVKPKSGSHKLFGSKKFSNFQVTCTRDCKVGEEFKVKLNYKDMLSKEIENTTEITIKVVEPNQDL